MKKKMTQKYVTEAKFQKHSDRIDRRFEQIDRRFEEVDRRFEQIDQRFDRLESKVDRMGIMLIQHDCDIKEIKETMMTREMGRQMLDQIMNRFDGLAAKFEESERARLIHMNQLMEFRPQLQDHEKRITALENPA